MKANFYKKHFVLMTVLFFTYSKVQSQLISQGPLNPAMVNEEYGPCLSCPGANWTNHMNAMIPDGMYAQTQLGAYSNCFMTTCFYARGMITQNFGFSIPVTSTITGIKAEVLRKASANQDILDTIVRLYKGGMLAGNNKASIIYWTTTAAYEAYGDSTDLWGATWTAADINANDFGLFYKPRNKAMNTNFITAFVDHVQITVYYITATGLQEQQQGTSDMIYDNSSVALIISDVTGKTSVSLLEIYDDTGKLVMEKHFEKEMSNEKIYLRELKKGIYIAKLSRDDHQTILKFLTGSR
jgi:type IX secretion system substrate protein